MEKLAFIVGMYVIMFGIVAVAVKCKLKKMAKKDKNKRESNK